MIITTQRLLQLPAEVVEVLAGKILEVNRGLASHPEGN